MCCKKGSWLLGLNSDDCGMSSYEGAGLVWVPQCHPRTTYNFPLLNPKIQIKLHVQQAKPYAFIPCAYACNKWAEQKDERQGGGGGRRH